MEKKMGMGRYVLILISLTTIATLITVGLALFGYTVTAAIIGTVTFFLWLSLLIVTTAVVTSWWSATLMERGARLVQEAVVSDDRLDGIMMQQIGNLVSQILRLVQTQTGEASVPLPSQQLGEWMPPVNRITAPKRPEVLDGAISFAEVKEGRNE